MNNKLAVLGDIERRLSAVKTLDEAKSIRDQAEAIRIYAKSARKGLEIQNHAAFVKIQAERRAGELLSVQVPHNGGRPKANADTLSSLGVAPEQSHRWQTMASVPETDVRKIVAQVTEAADELTSAAIYRHGRSLRAPLTPAPVVTPGFPDGPFRTLVIDPPWPIEKIVLDRRPIEREVLDYPTWSLDRIRDELPIARLGDSNGAHVYLWVTHKFLPEGLRLFEAWGVRYECLLTWFKPTAQPLWWTYNTEHVLFGKIGALAPMVKGTPVGFKAPQQRHSHKPDEFFELVRRVSPEPRLTMFDDARLGFKYWGVVHAA